jgi:hypothetical protein
MRRRLSISVLLAAGLFAMAAAGQPPQPILGDPIQFVPKKADPTDVAIAAALTNDPDVKIANAKVQLAEAEVAKAKQAVVLKVMNLKATIEELKRAVDAAQIRLTKIDQLGKEGAVDQALVNEERNKLENARAALAKAETEMKLLTGGDRIAPLGDLLNFTSKAEMQLRDVEAERRQTARALEWFALMQAGRAAETVKGPLPDRIRAALDKPVKLGAKGDKFTFAKAMEVFKKDAGFDVPVRGEFPLRPYVDPKNPTAVEARPIEIVSEGEEMPVGAWFQLLEDNAVFTQLGKGTTRFRFYVREYGLFLTSADAAPPEAPTLMDFWKQKPAAAKKETAPEPKGR